jgi:hypothetical protein
MEGKYAYLILLGLVIGVLFGNSFGAANDNTLLGAVIGATGGLFFGWLAAIAAQENSEQQKE